MGLFAFGEFLFCLISVERGNPGTDVNWVCWTDDVISISVDGGTLLSMNCPLYKQTAECFPSPSLNPFGRETAPNLRVSRLKSSDFRFLGM